MKNLRLARLCPTAAMFVSLSTFAQQLPPSNANPVSALQAFEQAGSEEYRLGAGDQVSIMVAGHSEATGKQTVGPDGIVTLPYAGAVNVADLTRADAAKAIAKALSLYYENPSVVVGVDVYSSNNLIVLGAVEHPGTMALDAPTTLLTVIARAGSPTQASPIVMGKPALIPDRVAVFRGTQNVMWIDFKRALENADPRLQLHLRKNDVVYVPSPDERCVSVFGEVVHPGLVELQDGSTLIQLIAEAGGIAADRSGRYPKIQIIHGATGSIQVVDYEDILQSRKIDVRLQSGDIIYVPQSKFERLAVTFQKISPLISIATVATLIEQP